MATFLGVPVRIRDSVYGNLYLTEKRTAASSPSRTRRRWSCSPSGPASPSKTPASTATRRNAATSSSERSPRSRRRWRSPARSAARRELDRILELIVKRGRALVDARSMFVALRVGGRLTIDAVAGELDRSLEQRAVASRGNGRRGVARPTDGRCICAGRCGRRRSRRCQASRRAAALLVPLVFRGPSVGVLGALDPASGAERFTRGRRARAGGVREQRRDRGRHRPQRRRGAGPPRHRGVRERAPALGAGAARRDAAGPGQPEADPVHGPPDGRSPGRSRILDQAVEQITEGIASLRHLINDLRPPILDEAGVQPAIEHLASRVTATTGLPIEVDLDLAYESRARAHPPQPAARGHALPRGAGGAHQRRQARRRELGDGVDLRA